MDLAFVTVYLTLYQFVDILQIEHDDFFWEIEMVIINCYFVLHIGKTGIELLVNLIQIKFQYQILQTLK